MLPKVFSPLNNFYKLIKSGQRRKNFQEEIEQELRPSAVYFILLGGATVLATLGLLSNNSVVVMGAMIIAPLYWPLLGLALGVAKMDKKILQRSSLLTVISILFCLLISYTVARLSPIYEITDQIGLRTNPTILDFVIAMVSALVGIAAIYYPMVSTAVIGVALSLSLLPALATMGIGLVFNSSLILRGAANLFLVNVLSIVFMGAVAMYILKIRSGQKNRGQFWLGLIGIWSCLLILAIPLARRLQQNQVLAKQKNLVYQEVQTQLKEQFPEVEFYDFEFEALSDQSDFWKAQVMLLVPESVELTRSDLLRIEDQIRDKHYLTIFFNWKKISTQNF
jgi:uncharacterized hydrophobic protein (TIGR00271 family)